VVCAVICVAGFHTYAQADPRAPGSADFARQAQKAYEDARARYRAETNNPDIAGQFARTCFDWADYATTDAQRAEIAEEGIAACQGLLKSVTNSVPGHYYLAMNLGQLARTKSLGALHIVTQMEAEFNLVLELEPGYSFAGPDRNLGLLYLDAPNWPLSLGSNTKARQHLQKALKLAPDYPENHLNLIEAELEWGDKKAAAAGLKALDEMWPDARKKLPGDEWAADWADWQKRRDAAWKQVRGSSNVEAAGGK
jgi:tetratricopeptide (TPR) repeat protein